MGLKLRNAGIGAFVGLITAVLLLLTDVYEFNPPYVLFVIMLSALGGKYDIEFLRYWTSDSSFPHPTAWAYLLALIPTLITYALAGLLIGHLYAKLRGKRSPVSSRKPKV